MDTATKDMVASIKTSNDVRATIDIGSHAILVRPTLTPNLSPIFTPPLISQYNNTAFCHFRSEYKAIVEKEQTACKE